MCANLADSNEFAGFWNDFKGKKTLCNAIDYFVQNTDHTNTDLINNFVINVMQKIVGRDTKTRKLVDLLEFELSGVDFADIPVRGVSSSASKRDDGSFEKISIFDADKLDGSSFESFIAKILKSNGFTNVSVTRGSGDQGGDILASRGDERLILQAERYPTDKKVTNSAVYKVLGAIAWYNVNKGIVVTNSIFTNSAKELAKRNNIELWDRKVVSSFIEVHNSLQIPENI